MTTRVQLKDLSKEELIDYRQTLECLAIKIANENDTFKCTQCLSTLHKILDIISLMTEIDEDFNELCDEIYEICGLEY